MRNLGYYHPDLGDDPESDPFAAADVELTKKVAAVLQAYHGNVPFMAEVSHRQGLVTISIPTLMGNGACYAVHIKSLHSDPGMKAIRNACGELLERFRLPRSGFSPSDFAIAINSRPLFERMNGAVPE